VFQEYHFGRAASLINPHVAKPLSLNLTVESAKDQASLSYLHIQIIFEHDGVALSELQPIAIEQTYNLMRQSANALLLLHNFEIAHFDIKPANMVYDAKKDLLKIVDMGSAFGNSSRKKLAATTVNLETKVTSATPEFSPPEVLFLIRGLRENVDMELSLPSIDVYCWAMSFFTILTNRSNIDLKNYSTNYKTELEADYKGFMEIVEISFNSVKPKNSKEEKLMTIISNLLTRALQYKPKERLIIKDAINEMKTFERKNSYTLNYSKTELEHIKHMLKLLVSKDYVNKMLKKDKKLSEEANDAEIELEDCFEKCIGIHKVKEAANECTEEVKKKEELLEEFEKRKKMYANEEEEHKRTMTERRNKQVELNKKNKELEEENKRLSDTNMKLKEIKAEYDEIVKNIEDNKEKLRNEFTSKQNELRNLKEQIEKVNEEKTKIDEQYKKRLSELNTVTTKLKVHEEAFEELDVTTGKLDKIKFEIAKQNDELEKLKKRCSEKKEENDKLNLEEVKAKRSLNDIEDEKKKLIEESNQLKATSNGLEDLIEAYKKDKLNIEKEACLLKKKLSDLKSEAKYWEIECNKKCNKYNELQANVKRTRHEGGIFEENIRKQRDKSIQNNKIELKKYKDRMKQKITDLKNMHKELLEQYKELKGNHKIQSAGLYNLIEDLKNVRSKIDKSKRQIDHTKSLEERYNQEKQQLINRINNLKNKLTSRNNLFYYTLKNIKVNEKEIKELTTKINHSFNAYKDTFSVHIVEIVKGIKAQREGITNTIERIKILCSNLTEKFDPEDLLNDNSTTQLRLEGRNMSALYNFIENVTRMMLHAYNKAKHKKEIKKLNVSHNKSGVDKIIKEYENDKKIALATIDSLLGQEKLSYEQYAHTQSNTELIRKIKMLGDVKDKLMKENEIIRERFERALEEQKDNPRQPHNSFQRREGNPKAEDDLTIEIKTLKERNSKLEARYQNYISKLKNTKQSIMFLFGSSIEKKAKDAIRVHKEQIESVLKDFKDKYESKTKKSLEHLKNDHIKVNKKTFINKVTVAVEKLQHIISKNNKEIYSKLDIKIKTYDLIKLNLDKFKQKKEFEIECYMLSDYTELEEDNEEIKISTHKRKSKT